MATATDIKNATTYPADKGNPITTLAFTTSNTHLANLAAMIEVHFDFAAKMGRAPNESDAARLLNRLLVQWYKDARRDADVAAIEPAREME